MVGRLLPVRLDEDVAAAIGRVTVNVVAVQEGRYLSEQETASGRLSPVAIPPPVIEAPVVEPVADETVPLEDYEPPDNVLRLNPYHQGKK